MIEANRKWGRAVWLGYQRIAKLCDLCDSPFRPLRENISLEFFSISFPQKTLEKKGKWSKEKNVDWK